MQDHALQRHHVAVERRWFPGAGPAKQAPVNALLHPQRFRSWGKPWGGGHWGVDLLWPQRTMFLSTESSSAQTEPSSKVTCN